jgi:hypothetical protein
MDTLNKLLSIDINYIIIGLMVLFYTLEQVLSTYLLRSPFISIKRTSSEELKK